jgi:conjugal transfer/entry exclusion protein
MPGLRERMTARLAVLKAEQERVVGELAKVPQLQAQANAVAGAIGEIEALLKAEAPEEQGA